MKKINSLLMVLALGLVFVVTGCESVATGDYKEGTYFGSGEKGSTAVVYVNENGKIASVFIDVAYGKTCTVDGVETKCATTKQILGDEYGMKKASPIGKEWYEQANALAAKVVEEQGTDSIKLYYKDAEGNLVETDPQIENARYGKDFIDGVAGVTVAASDMVSAVNKALEQAK